MAGFIVHWMKYYAQLGNDCLHPTVVYAGDVRKIEVLHMFGSYVVLGVGIGISMIAFVAEYLYAKFIRPCLPEKWKADSSTAHDYYNKIFVGYGYSNVRPTTPTKQKVQTVPGGSTLSLAMRPPATAAPLINSGPVMNGTLPRVQLKNTSENLPTGLYDPNLSGNYNSRTNYNYYNYGNNKNATNFSTNFGMNSGI